MKKKDKRFDKKRLRRKTPGKCSRFWNWRFSGVARSEERRNPKALGDDE